MKKSLFAVVALLITCTSMAYAQDGIDSISTVTGFSIYDFDFVGGGARAKGMGNAFIGVSNDVTAGSWNPAGLFEIDKTTFGITRFNMNPRGTTTSKSSTETLVSNHSGALNGFSAINFVSPIRISGHPFVFSVNLTRNFLTFNQFDFHDVFEREIVTFAPLGIVFTDTNAVDFKQSFNQEGSMNSLNLGFGTRLYDNISFGVTTNIYYGTSILNINTLISTENLRYRNVQFATIDTNAIIEDTNKFSGANFTIGLMYNGDKFDAGLTVRTPFSLDENRDQGIYSVVNVNGIAEITDTTYFGDILYQYELPLMIGAGIGYNVNENWLLAGDIEYRNFSGKKVNFRVSQTINPGGSNIENFVVQDPKWNNSFSVRLGTEYLKQFDFGVVPFRAGFGYVPVPSPSVSFDGTSTAVVNYNYSVGTGIHWEQIHFDVAYTYQTSNSEIRQVVSDFDFKNHTISAAFTGVF